MSEVLNQYLQIYTDYNQVRAKLKSLLAHSTERDGEIAALDALTQQWSALKPVRDEFAAIEDEIRKLASVEDLRIAAAGAFAALGDEDAGALTVLGTVRKFLESAKGKDAALDEIASSVAESFFLADDAHGTLASYLANLEADPKRLDYLNERKASVTAFVKKWGSAGSIDEELAAIAIRVKNAKETIADLSGGQERITAMEEEVKVLKKK